MRSYNQSSGSIPYTKTKGPKQGMGGKAGTVLGPYASQPALNKKVAHKNQGGKGSTGRALNKSL